MGALSETKAHAVVAVADLEKALAFYRDTLGLTVVNEMPDGAATLSAGAGTFVDVYVSQFAGTARSTSVDFEVDDLDAVMAELRSRGVVFEEYDMGELKTTNGVADAGGVRGAWFKDPEGNIVGLVEPG